MCYPYTCRTPYPLQIDHIVDYARVRRHEFHNMIVLCSNCHDRKTRGDIDRKDLMQYKANLGIINSRYSDLERHVLEYYARRFGGTRAPARRQAQYRSSMANENHSSDIWKCMSTAQCILC